MATEHNPNLAYDRACEHVTAHTETSFVAAYLEILKKMNHREKTCTCKSCLISAVREINIHLEWLDPEGQYPRFETDGKQICEVGCS